MSGKIHVFEQDLAASLEYNGEWDSYYHTVWDGQVESVEFVSNLEEQKQGIDRRIILKSGQVITVDEKHREKDYGDMLIELWSQFYGDGDSRNKPGWAVDWKKRVDYIAYAVIPSETCHLIPYDQLRRTTRKRMRAWAAEQGSRWRKVANNGRYTTINIAVRFERLYLDLSKDAQQPWKRFWKRDHGQ